MMAITHTDQTVQVPEGHAPRRQQLRRRRDHQDVGQGRRARRGQPLRPRDGRHQARRADAARPVALDARRPAALARLRDHACPTWMAISVSRHLRRRDDGRRRRRRQRRDDARRHQGARRLGLRLAEVGAGRDHAREGQGARSRSARSTRASTSPTSAATCRPRSTNGSIILDRIDSGNVDLYTVNGNISYDGADQGQGALPPDDAQRADRDAGADKANVTLTVRTYNGGFRSTFPLKLRRSEPRKKRFTVTLGNGSAHVELESFGGTIALRRPGDPRPETERKRRARSDKDKDKDKDKGQGHARALGDDRASSRGRRAIVDAAGSTRCERSRDRPRHRRRAAIDARSPRRCDARRCAARAPMPTPRIPRCRSPKSRRAVHLGACPRFRRDQPRSGEQLARRSAP